MTYTEQQIRDATADELRVMVAETQGWTHISHRYHIRRDYGTWHGHPSGWDGNVTYAGPQIPDWPRDIAAAWGLIEDAAGRGWSVSIYPGKEDCAGAIDGHVVYDEPTAPIAICRAWMLAVNAASGTGGAVTK